MNLSQPPVNLRQVKQPDPIVTFQSTDVCGIPVDILKAGKSKTRQPKELILVIPGNPGIVDYYSTFIQSLYKEINGSKDVWAVSHSCHSLHGSSLKGSSCSSPLEDEIEHKLTFLEHLVPRDCNVTLIGHSIGCYMILSVLEILSGYRNRCTFSGASIPDASTGEMKSPLLPRIKKCYLLFPTIERMKSSPNGKGLWLILRYFQWLAIGAVTLLSWFPLGLRKKIAQFALGRKCCSNSSMIKPTLDLLTQTLFGNMLALAYDELSNVTSLHTNSIKSLKSKLVFYFGINDGWCPLSYRNDLVRAIPDVNNYVDDKNVAHAFVLSDSKTMASVVAKQIIQNSIETN